MAAILVGVLAVLAVVVLMTSPGSGAPVAGQMVPLVAVPASQIGGVTVTDADGLAVTVENDPAWGAWVVREERDGGEGSAWPASETTRSAGVRVLANARVTLGQKHRLHGPHTVSIVDQAGEQIGGLLVFKEQVLGGRVPVVLLPERSGTIERELASFLSPESLLGWRDQTLLPGLDAGAVALSIARGDETLSLRRVGSAWTIESPVRESADAAAVRGLIERLISARSQRFVGVPPENGDLTLRVESGPSGDRRVYSAAVDTGSLVCEVRLGRAVGEETTPIARAWVQVAPDLSALLDIGVTDLVSRRSTPTPASEVAALSLSWSGRELARTSSGWATPEDAAAASAWLDVLTSREADDIALAPGDGDEIGTITLRGFGDLAMGTYQIRADTTAVWVAQSRVWRGYRLSEGELARLGVR